MSSLTFRGVVLNRFDCRRAKGGGDTYLRVYFDSDLTKPVCEEMGWSPGEGCPAGDLDGELAGRTFVHIPGNKAFKDYEVQLSVSEVGDFKFSSERDDEGHIKRRFLHFIAKTRAPDAETWLRKYMTALGDHLGTLKVTYEANAQGTLPGVDAAGAEAVQ